MQNRNQKYQRDNRYGKVRPLDVNLSECLVAHDLTNGAIVVILYRQKQSVPNHRCRGFYFPIFQHQKISHCASLHINALVEAHPLEPSTQLSSFYLATDHCLLKINQQIRIWCQIIILIGKQFVSHIYVSRESHGEKEFH